MRFSGVSVGLGSGWSVSLAGLHFRQIGSPLNQRSVSEPHRTQLAMVGLFQLCVLFFVSLSEKDFLLRQQPIIHIGAGLIPTQYIELMCSLTYPVFKGQDFCNWFSCVRCCC